MPIVLKSGEVVYPTIKRPECPVCRQQAHSEKEHGEMLRVRDTQVTDEPQVFMRKYRCAKCGYTLTERYIMPRHEDDYLSAEEIERRAERGKARSEHLKAMNEVRRIAKRLKDEVDEGLQAEADYNAYYDDEEEDDAENFYGSGVSDG